MQPTFKELDDFSVYGMEYIGKNENGEIPVLWTKFNEKMGKYYSLVDASYGVCIEEKSLPIGEFRYICGIPPHEKIPFPDNFVNIDIPKQQYAIFTHKGKLDKLSQTYNYIYKKWLPDNGAYNRVPNPAPEFEYYDMKFKLNDDSSEFFIYIPVQKIA